MLSNEWLNLFQVIYQLRVHELTQEHRTKGKTNTKSDLCIYNATKDTLLVVFKRTRDHAQHQGLTAGISRALHARKLMFILKTINKH